MRTLIIILSLLPLPLFAQQYSEIVEVPGKTADQLYASGRMWFAENFKSANQVLQMDDQKSGVLIGKGNMSNIENFSLGIAGPTKSEWIISFTIKLMIKEGKYKTDMSDFYLDNYLSGDLITRNESLTPIYNNKDFYKNGSDPEWLKKTGAKSNTKMASKINQAYYNHLVKFEENIKAINESLKKAMTATENW